MTTAELIKKRQEEKDKPLKENPTSFTSMTTKPDPSNIAGMKTSGDDSVNQQVAKDLNHAYEIERQIDANEGKQGAVKVSQAGKEALMQRPDDAISLYEIGKNTAGIKSVKDMAASPLKTPEYDDFRKQVIGEKHFGVESEEDAAKRERRDYIRQGLTGLTEGLSALANLYYTTKWAPNQKFNSQMPALQQRLYQERIERDKKLENFRNWQRGEAARDSERAFQLSLYNRKQADADKAAARKAMIDAQAAKIKYLRDLGLIDARKAADLEKQQGKAALDKELAGLKQKYAKEIAAINNKAAMDRVVARNENSGGGRGVNATIRVPIGKDGEYAEYRKSDLTSPINISRIYNSLPNQYRVKGKEKVWNSETKSMEFPYDENPSTQKMEEAIGKALADGYLTEMAPEIEVGSGKKDVSSKKDNDNTPPSRRGKKDEDNIPPSKRNK